MIAAFSGRKPEDVSRIYHFISFIILIILIFLKLPITRQTIRFWVTETISLTLYRVEMGMISSLILSGRLYHNGECEENLWTQLIRYWIGRVMY